LRLQTQENKREFMSTEEENKEIDAKKEELVVPALPATYRDRIDSLLSRVAKGEKVNPEPTNPAEENKTYKKMKELGGIQKGLPELFKIDESAFDEKTFDMPHYDESEEDEIVGTKLYRVKPPSNHPDADEYWTKVSPHLQRIGQPIPHEAHKPGCLEMEVVNSEGQPETLKITLVRDEANHDRPTLVFEYKERDNLTPAEVSKLVGRVGLKPDHISSKTLRGVVVMDVVDK
jgi:hypothetical protein